MLLGGGDSRMNPDAILWTIGGFIVAFVVVMRVLEEVHKWRARRAMIALNARDERRPR